MEQIKKEAATVKAAGSSQYNPGWHEALSLGSMLTTAEAVTRAGLLRTESRGAHTREDFFSEDKEWEKYNNIIRKGKDGNMEVEKVLRPEPDAELKRIAMSTIEDLEKEVAKDNAEGKW